MHKFIETELIKAKEILSSWERDEISPQYCLSLHPEERGANRVDVCSTVYCKDCAYNNKKSLKYHIECLETLAPSYSMIATVITEE